MAHRAWNKAVKRYVKKKGVHLYDVVSDKANELQHRLLLGSDNETVVKKIELIFKKVRLDLSYMYFCNIPFLKNIILLDHLPVINGRAPYFFFFYLCDKVLVYFQGEILQGTFPGKHKGAAFIGPFARGLGIDAD